MSLPEKNVHNIKKQGILENVPEQLIYNIFLILELTSNLKRSM